MRNFDTENLPYDEFGVEIIHCGRYALAGRRFGILGDDTMSQWSTGHKPSDYDI